jgi:hypothetical protein
MSMIGCFYALDDGDLNAIIEKPDRLESLWKDLSAQLPEKQPSFIGRLFGAKPKQEVSREPAWQPSQKAEAFDIDKAWQGIHFLLTGSDWEGDGPLAFILHGGREIKKDLGYGPPHGFTSAEVKAIDAALQKIDSSALYEGANPADFARKEIYPEIWETEPKEQSIGYLIENLKLLQKFIHQTAQSNLALIAYLG